MATSLFRVPTQNALQYTLDSQIAAGANSLTLSSTGANIIRTPGVLVIDRVDTSGNPTATKREYFTFTGNSGTAVTGLVGAQAGSTQQIHAAGAVVEFIPDVIWADAIYTTFTEEHDIYGTHISLASVNVITTNSLAVQSTASIRDLLVTDLFSASGASIQAFPLIPVWVQSGTVSGASTNLGKPVDMPRSGTIQFATAISRIGSSGASLFLDITKNGTTIFTGANGSQTVFQIPINGTFVSTASIAVVKFVAGDVFNWSVLGSGSMLQDLSVKFYAR